MSDNLIFTKLAGVKTRFEDVGNLINQPDIISDMKRYVKLNKEYKDLQPIVEAYNKYTNMTNISLIFLYNIKHWLGTDHCSACNQWYDDQKLDHSCCKITDTNFTVIIDIKILCTV